MRFCAVCPRPILRADRPKYCSPQCSVAAGYKKRIAKIRAQRELYKGKRIEN